MADPAKTVAATIRYEVRIIYAPRSFDFRGECIALDKGGDLPVLVRITVMGATVLEEAIVGVIGGAHRWDPREFLSLRAFLASGGIIGLNKDLL